MDTGGYKIILASGSPRRLKFFEEMEIPFSKKVIPIDENFPDNDANNEPDSWYLEIEDWGFPDKLNNELTARTVPLAGVAEMADRVYYDNWDDNLDEVLQ